MNMFSTIVNKNIHENNLENIVQFVALDWKNDNDFQNLKSNNFFCEIKENIFQFKHTS